VAMAEPLPRWLMRAYSRLWVAFKMQEFGSEQASATLLKRGQATSLVLSELRKAGWLSVKLDANDTRKRRYQLNSPEIIVCKIAGDSDG
jgi:hypothetical protein